SPIGSRLCRSNAQVAPSPRGNRVPEGVSSAGGAEPSRISQGRCSMLELLASKGARAVLRGGGTGDRASLPDVRHEVVGGIVTLRCHPWFCPRYPIGTCVAGNGGVRSSRDNVSSLLREWS